MNPFLGALAVLVSSWHAYCARADESCSGSGDNPWVYNFAVDGMPAKVINDAEGVFPVNLGFIPVEQQKLAARSQRLRFLNETAVTLNVNILYIDSKDGGILFDTGSGPNDVSGLFAGTLFKSLEAEGISRNSIKKIFLTHADVDHIGGAVENFDSFEPAFPEATVYISRANFDYWTAETVDFGERVNYLSEDFLIPGVEIARTVFDKLGKKLKKFDVDEEIVPGVRAISTPWHMPGHVSYVIKDGPSYLVFTGDAVTVTTQSIEDPRFILYFDVRASEGPAGRVEMLDMVAEKRWKLLSVHATHPGLMHVRNLALGFEAIPVPYQGSVDTVSVCSLGSYGEE